MDELRELIVNAAGREGTIDGLLLSVVTAPTPPTSSLASPTFALVAQGRKRLALGEQVFEYGAGDYLVVSVDLPVTGHFVEASPAVPCLGVGLALKPEIIAELLLDAYQKKIRLQEARLRVVGLGEDVTSAGYAVGYDSPSQFSREYRREFGTPPSRDRAGSGKSSRALV